MCKSWVENEFENIDLGDQRLQKRLSIICQRFAESPQSPINHACSNWPETKAAYRFFQNKNVSYKEILKSHQQATLLRAAGHDYILAIQDTSYFNYSNHFKTMGLGTISKFDGKNKKDIAVKGLIVHTSLAATVDGLVLGVLDQNIYSRLPRSQEKQALKEKSHGAVFPIQEKESYKWIQALENTVRAFGQKANRVVTVCDREADIYDLFARADQLNTHVLIRAMQNRVVNRESPYSQATGEKLYDLLNKQKTLGRIEIKIPKQTNKPERKALCEVSACKFTLNPSEHHFNRKDILPKNMPVYAIHVKEINALSLKDAIDWKLLTNLAVTSFEEALEKIKWYCIRWRIEIWHKILKSGLQVEDCRLTTAPRLIRYLSVMSIVAWRIFWITLVARAFPEDSCLLFLNDIEWKVLYRKFNKKNKEHKQFPAKPPSMSQAVSWIAQLGGFLARKNDKLPGNTHIWRGLKKFTIMIETVAEMNDFVGNS